jgi:hypothetical protein
LHENKSGEYYEWSNFFINFMVRKLPDIECVVVRGIVVMQDPSIRQNSIPCWQRASCNLAIISCRNVGLLVSVWGHSRKCEQCPCDKNKLALSLYVFILWSLRYCCLHALVLNFWIILITPCFFIICDNSLQKVVSFNWLLREIWPKKHVQPREEHASRWVPAMF